MFLDSVWLVLKFYFLIKTCLGSNSGEVILLEGSFLYSSIICLSFEEGRRIYLLFSFFKSISFKPERLNKCLINIYKLMVWRLPLLCVNYRNKWRCLNACKRYKKNLIILHNRTNTFCNIQIIILINQYRNYIIKQLFNA